VIRNNRIFASCGQHRAAAQSRGCLYRRHARRCGATRFHHRARSDIAFEVIKRMSAAAAPWLVVGGKGVRPMRVKGIITKEQVADR